MFNRKQYQELEQTALASFAMKSRDSKGRRHSEPEHPYRSAFQRDRDRIIHSTAFRRLEYKTQVFVNYEGDYYRTRLTHTLEVAQIARTIARALRLNEDLVETIALAHDLGHTPFGHAGEETLRKLMQDHGGFEHNQQGLRVVDYLEQRYADFKGLNLTWEVREGILKHTTAFDAPQLQNLKGDKTPPLKELGGSILVDKTPADKSPTLEAQVVDVADEIAYDSHDLDDGITSGLIDTRDLETVELWQEAQKQICKKYPQLEDEIKKYQIIKFLINLQVEEVIRHTELELGHLKIKTQEQVKNCPRKLLTFTPELDKKREHLREFLNQKLYQHYKVVRMSSKAKRFVQELFQCYLANPEQLPPSSRSRLEHDGVSRVVCDYIAGMTDRYAQNEYRRLFQPDGIM
ncbi:MAG: deoxyguanosinetriphosphate triphosphohydrolase [Candidatus Omnitrophica bacterium]|nr:deoxyguanosinetriphosphate triphosphohydrolase [Candidatus Omnitrophota bacterium]